MQLPRSTFIKLNESSVLPLGHKSNSSNPIISNNSITWLGCVSLTNGQQTVLECSPCKERTIQNLCKHPNFKFSQSPLPIKSGWLTSKVPGQLTITRVPIIIWTAFTIIIILMSLLFLLFCFLLCLHIWFKVPYANRGGVNKLVSCPTPQTKATPEPSTVTLAFLSVLSSLLLLFKLFLSFGFFDCFSFLRAGHHAISQPYSWKPIRGYMHKIKVEMKTGKKNNPSMEVSHLIHVVSLLMAPLTSAWPPNPAKPSFLDSWSPFELLLEE